MTHDGKVFTVPMKRSFTCASVEPLHLNGSFANITGTLTMLNAQVEAFGINKEKTFSAGWLACVFVLNSLTQLLDELERLS